MSKVVVFTNLSLDGVMQAPGRPDEDRRGGFEHGGWGAPYAAMPSAGGTMASAGALLLGRRTYEDFYSVWPNRTDNPYTAVLNNIQKYVASTTLSEPLSWSNSVIMGSGVLVQSLMRRNLVDEYVLLIHPLILGSGRRLFPDGGAFAALRLVDTKTTTTGVVIATYQPDEPTARKTSGAATP